MSRRRNNPFAQIAARLRGASKSHTGHLLDDPGERLRFSAAIPGFDGLSMLKISLETHTEPDAMGGERTRLRAHIQANLASAVRPALAALSHRAAHRAQALAAALPAPKASKGTGVAQGGLMPVRLSQVSEVFAPLRNRAEGWLAERANRLLPAIERTLEPLLEHDLQTWVEMHASTSPLYDGAKTLLPNAEGLAKLGIHPVEGPEGTPLQAWSGAVGNEAAQVMLLRLDEKSLPEQFKSALAGKPFQLAAAVVSVATRK